MQPTSDISDFNALQARLSVGGSCVVYSANARVLGYCSWWNRDASRM